MNELGQSLPKMSPALANRLTIVFVHDCAFSEDGSISLGTLAKDLYDSDPENRKSETSVDHKAVQMTTNFLFNVKHNFPFSQGGPLITLRTLVRVIRGARAILCDHPDFHVADALYTCCQLSIFQQLNSSAEDRLRSLFEELEEKFRRLKGFPASFIDFLSEYNIHEDSSFVLHRELTPTRYRYGNVVLFGIKIGFPVLLEGPAAAGKTSLIESIMRRSGRKGCLHRVINSESTSIQDYLGTFVPCGDGKFQRLNGPLRTAMKNGGFFLSDEFNLADPSVLNMLLPLLEGRKLIYDPVSGIAIRAHKDFRFFATQNNVTYAARKRLSVSLRSRFIEAQVKEFAEGELAYILQHRNYSCWNRKSPFRRIGARDSLALNLEKAFLKINEAVEGRSLFLGNGKYSCRLTLREMIKWVERYGMFSELDENRKMDSLLGRAGLSLLVPRIRASNSLSISQSEQKLRELLTSSDLLKPCAAKTTSSFLKEAGGCFLSDGFAKRFFRCDNLSPTLLSRHLPKEYRLTFSRIHIAIDTNEPVLLVGPTTFKTTIVEDYLALRNYNFAVVQLSYDTQVSDLLGQMHPFLFEAAVRQLLQTASQLCHFLGRRVRALSSATLIGKIVKMVEEYKISRSMEKSLL